MISRRECRQIARDWVLDKANEEHGRRIDSLTRMRRGYHEFAHKVNQPYAEAPAFEHYRLAADALLAGMYDPPTPRIPSVWRRLRLRDWTPADPTPEQWPMYTGPGTASYERHVSVEGL